MLEEIDSERMRPFQQHRSPNEAVALTARESRSNPIKGERPPLEDVLKTMRERALKFNVEKVKSQDLAGAGGPPDEA